MQDPPAHLRPANDRRFHRDTWNQLSSLDVRLLDEIAFLSRKTAERSPSRAHYCVPGRTYLGERLACSQTTISRHTSKLRSLGLLDKRQRRPRQGQWQTCLYRLIHPIAWTAARAIRAITWTARRVPRTTHIAPSLTGRSSVRQQKESLRDIIRRGLDKWGP